VSEVSNLGQAVLRTKQLADAGKVERDRVSRNAERNNREIQLKSWDPATVIGIARKADINPLGYTSYNQLIGAIIDNELPRIA
jgi:hypothetical protein